MRGLSVQKEVINFYYNKPVRISDEDFSMYGPYLTAELKQFSRNFYGKELDYDNLVLAVKEIVRNYARLSCVEIKFVLNQIVMGEYEIGKYAFNIADILKCIKIYNSKKLAVQDAWFKAVKDENESAVGRQLAHAFLQTAMKKQDNNEHLTIYEKSALGKNYAKELDGKILEDLMAITVEQLPQRQKELSKQRTASIENVFIDHEMNVPFMWSEQLLFGVLVYNYKSK